MARFRKGSYTPHEFFDGRHRSEHWYRDNTVYFITARCAERFPALASEEAKSVFWDRFGHYTSAHTFTPIVTSVLDNHYHVLGYLKIGEELPTMMRKLHGSVAKLVNDLLSARRVPFWGEGRDTYFDGCIRDELPIPTGVSVRTTSGGGCENCAEVGGLSAHTRGGGVGDGAEARDGVEGVPRRGSVSALSEVV